MAGDKASVQLIDEALARKVANAIYLRRPYPQIKEAAIDSWHLFLNHSLMSEVADAAVKLISNRAKDCSLITALSSWGYPFAVAIAAQILRTLRHRCDVLCLGGTIFPERNTAEMLGGQETLLIDQIIHTGNTLKLAVEPGGSLAELRLTAKMCIVIIDHNTMSPEKRPGLDYILRSTDLKMYSVTRATLAPRTSPWDKISHAKGIKKLRR